MCRMSRQSIDKRKSTSVVWHLELFFDCLKTHSLMETTEVQCNPSIYLWTIVNFYFWHLGMFLGVVIDGSHRFHIDRSIVCRRGLILWASNILKDFVKFNFRVSSLTPFTQSNLNILFNTSKTSSPFLEFPFSVIIKPNLCKTWNPELGF